MPKKKVIKTKSSRKFSKNRLYEHRAKLFVFFVIGVLLASLFMLVFIGIEDLMMYLGGQNMNELGNYINNPSY